MAKISSICVYCGSSTGKQPVFGEQASNLGRAIASRGIRLVYGGGRVGLMGLCADAALSAGGEVVGIIPEHLERKEVGHAQVSELIVVGSMHERKSRMSDMSDAFVVLPGGLGTLDETFEIITWKQLRLHDRPIVVIDIEGFWRPLLQLVSAQVEAGFVRPEHAELFTVVSSVDAVFDALDREAEPAIETKPERM